MTQDNMKPGFSISVIIPCYNEQENIPVIYERLQVVLNKYASYKILFIDDGSRDESKKRIFELAYKDSRVKYIFLTKNFGHQNAIKAGLDHEMSDCVITIDCDLQHPVELIDSMIDNWKTGYKIVYTIREEDSDASLSKSALANFFYRIFNSVSEVPLERGTADYRLLDKKVVHIIRSLPDNSPFFRGIISWVGFEQMSIKYKAVSRLNGKSKYTFKKMYNLGLNGLTSFSIQPLRFSLFFGFACSVVAFLYCLYAFYAHFFTDVTLPGWTSIVASITFFAGVQLIVLGVIGEYVGKIFMQAKGRPAYIINDTNLC